MSLSITIVSGGTTYALQAETFRLVYARDPMQAALAGNVNPVLIDMGSFRPSIVIIGTIRSTAGSDGANTIPSQQNLEDFIRTTWNATITITIAVVGVTNNYVSKISGCTFELTSGREDLWEFTLQAVTVGRT